MGQVKRLLGSFCKQLLWKSLLPQGPGNLLRSVWERFQRFLEHIIQCPRKIWKTVSWRISNRTTLRRVHTTPPLLLPPAHSKDLQKDEIQQAGKKEEDVDATAIVTSGASNRQAVPVSTSLPGRLAQSSAPLLAALGLLSPALPALTRQCSADLNDKSITTTFEQIYNNSRSCAVFTIIQLNRSSLSDNVNPGDNVLSNTPVSDPLVSLVIPGLPGTTDFTTGTGSGEMPAPVLEPSASNLDFTINAVEVAQAATPPKPTNFWGRAGNESSVILHWGAIATATSWEFRYRRLGQRLGKLDDGGGQRRHHHGTHRHGNSSADERGVLSVSGAGEG